VAIVTRGHSEDEQCLRAAMRVDADYVGLIGSKRRTNIVLQRLRENGADEGRLARVRAPVGLDLGAVTPEEVALAIMAEIVAVRRGEKVARFRSGGDLRHKRSTRNPTNSQMTARIWCSPLPGRCTLPPRILNIS